MKNKQPPISLLLVASALLGIGAVAGGCPRGEETNPPGFENSSDKTNGGARLVGASSCVQCHTEIAKLHATHGHAHALKPTQGGPPSYPEAAPGAGVPNPPTGMEWTDIAYVVGGYRNSANFVGQDGYLLTTGTTGVDTRWNLKFPANGTIAGFAPYEPAAVAPMPFDYSCFQCHTTGAAFDPDDPQNQDGRPGIIGTWSETGVQCEACHGPGGGHFRTNNGSVVIDTSRIFVDPDGSQTCVQCHNRPFDDRSGAILAREGFIQNQGQWPELRASGGHATFACTICHDPHRSLAVDHDAALRNTCSVCHHDATMAGHGGKVFRRGDYSEPLGCESCHMPYATRNAHSATEATVGPLGRMGDTRTHIFRISTEATNYTGMLTADGKQVLRDSQGRAAVTVDFVCLRCHNEFGPFALTVERAAEIAGHIHELP
jgi:hypothetical protein